MMRVNGVMQPFEKILKDSLAVSLLSDEGDIAVSRYDR
jgi:hypothetical protein